MQNGGYTNVKIRDCCIEDTLMDGIDHKNNGSVSVGNSINGLTLRRCGLKDDATFTAACLDLSTGWTVSNLNILEFGTALGGADGLRCKNGNVDDSRGIGGRFNTFSSVYIEADDTAQTTSNCIHLQNSLNAVTGFILLGGGNGIRAAQDGNKISNGHVAGCKTDGIVAVDSVYGTNGDRTQIDNVRVEGCLANGLNLATDNNIVRGCIVTGNGVNLRMTGNDTMFVDGEIGAVTGITTKQVTNTGTGNRITNTRGFRTRARLESPSFLIDTTGIKTPITVPHGLPFDPPDTSIHGVLWKRSANNSVAILTPRFTAADSTNITLQANVTVASSTSADTATLLVHVDAEDIPAL